MAIKSTVFKAQLTISDVTRNHYEDRALVLARHPSETDLRLIFRIVAFALNAHEHLQFAKGLATAEEPDLWEVDLTGQIQHWIELGQPTDKRIRQSCSKASRVSIYPYQRGGTAHWYDSVAATATRFERLSITQLSVADEAAVERFMDRNMALSCVIEDDQVLLSDEKSSMVIALTTIQARRRLT